LEHEDEEDHLMYRFSITDDMPYLASLPDEILGDIEANIADVIYESFIVPGDEDYFSARLLAIRGFHRAYYWSAAQCIEKYLKAYLVLRGKSVRKLSHSISALLKEAAKFDPAFNNIDVSPHTSIDIKDHERSFARTPSTDEFIEILDKYGSPDNRYNSYGATFFSGHVFALDSLASFVRRRIECPRIERSLRHTSQDTQSVFYEKNPWFDRPKALEAPRRLPIDSFYRFSGNVPKFEILVKNRGRGHCMHALAWLRKKMKLPDDDAFK